jgi:hypothetical protein
MRKKWLLWLVILLMVVSLSACSKAPDEKKIPKVGPLKINSHPSTLEDKTVVLRWNGKYNGDNFLKRVAELLTKQVKGVKIIKMWEVDPTTASMSESLEKSREFAEKVAKFKPHIVIASQAD